MNRARPVHRSAALGGLLAVLALLGVVTTAVPAVASPTATAPAPVTAAQSDPSDTGVDLPFDAADGSYRPITPVRLLDTRRDGGAIGPNGYGSVDVTGRAGIPLDSVGAIVVNLTVVAPTASGYLTLYATGSVGNHLSDVDFARGQTVANAVLAQVDDTGSLTIHNASGGSTQVLVDAVGYFFRGRASTAGAYEPVNPTRVLDTRTGTGAPRAAVRPGGFLEVRVTGADGGDPDALGAVAANVTVTAPTGDGYVSAWPDGSGRPVASSLNFTRGQTVAGLVVLPIGDDGFVDVYNGSSGTVQLILDVRAYFFRGSPTANGTVAAEPPSRVLDTRNGTGAPRAAVAPGATVRVPVESGLLPSVPRGGSVLLTLTVTAATGDGYVTAWPGGARPVVSSVNSTRGRTVANSVVVPVAADGSVSLFNGSSGTVHLVADRTGELLGADRTTAEVLPEDGMFTATADQVLSGTRHTDGTVTLVLAPDIPPPPVGKGLAAPETPGLPDGAAGVVTAVESEPDGTTRVEVAPASLDTLYADYDVSVNRTLQPSDVVGGTGADLAAGTADFSCSGSDPARQIQVALDLSAFHLDIALDSLHRSAHLQFSADPDLLTRYTFGAATTCTLAPGAGGTPLALHIPVTTTPPVYVDVQPELTTETPGPATMDRRSTTHVAVGFDRGNGHDVDVDEISGEAAGSATGAARIDLGLFSQVTLAGRVAISGIVGPFVSVADRGTGCSSLTGAVTTSWVPPTATLFPGITRAASGRFAEVVLRGCDWDQFPLLVAPGRIGNAVVGAPARTLSAAVGVPLQRTDEASCRRLETTDDRSDVMAYLDGSASRVTLLMAYRWTTAAGIRTGSTWAEIHAAYPATQRLHDTYSDYTLIDARDGTSMRIRIDQGRASFVYAGSAASVRSIPSC